MTKLRKALVVGVMSITVLSMSVVVAPEAGAAAVAGDLIKMDGLSSVYYLAADGKRYVFPNEATYFSWYSDFSGVVTIPQSELETYQLGANVTMRPGTKLVKIQTDPKVYAVEPNGNLLWVPSETVAIALFGTDWAARVVDVADAFFTNYTVTTEEVSETAYPAGSLVKFGEDATVYYIDAAGTARPVADEAAFLANRFKWDDIVSATIDKPTEGTPVSAAEGDLTDTSSGAGGTAEAGTGLTIALAGDSPASANLPSLSTLVPFTVVNLTASNDGDVTVQNMIFTRRGTGDAGDFDGGYLYVGDERLTTKRSVNTSENTITFTALNLNIPAGMTKAVSLKMNSLTAANSNHYFEVSSASDVTTNGAVVSGSFPLAGNAMAYTASVDAATVTMTNQTAATSYKIGETERTLVEFDIANNDKEIVNIYRIRLKQNDSAGDNSVSNISLDLDGTVVKTDVVMSGKYIDFILDNPYELKKSKTISAIVRCDIVDDIGKYLDFYLKNVADADIRGTAYGDYYSATIVKTNFAALGVSSGHLIQGSEINVSFDGPAAADTKEDVDDVVLANFKVKSENLDVNIESMRVVVTMNGADATDNLDNVEMVDSANGVSYSVSDPTNTDTTSELDFENIYLVAGVQYNFEIRGDIPATITASQSYVASIDFTAAGGTFTARFQDSDETTIVDADMSSVSLTGKTMSVAVPAVTFSKVTTSNATYVENADKVLLYKGKITANSVDDLRITKVKLNGTTGSLGNISTAFNKLYFYKINSDSTETELDTETSLVSENVSFSGFNLNVAKGASNGIYVVVRGDVKDSPSTGGMSFNWSSWGATTTNFNVKDSDNNNLIAAQYTVSQDDGQTSTVAAKGTYDVSFDLELAGINNAKNVLAGSMPLIGRLKFTAENENAIVEDLVIQNLGDATSDTLGTLYLYDNAEMSGTPLASADMVAGAMPRALFEDINIEIPVTGATYVYVAAMAKGIDYSGSPAPDSTASANKTIALRLPADATGYVTKVLGISTGEELVDPTWPVDKTATSTVYGAIMSNIATDFANGTLINGTAKDIFSFKVTAPSSSNTDHDGTELGIRMASTSFAVATSGSNVLLSSYRIERVGGANGEKTASAVYNEQTNVLTIGIVNSYGSSDTDYVIRPGDTAEFVIRASIDGSDTNDTLQVTIETVDSNVAFVHNVSSSATTATIRPKISGITNVRGGTLSN
ncbi:hypothetical protein KAR28_06705 [Candidatus Parcubacteria bacterium]|nr:hypothetical protein [Candidatus Parcubacteria bacterium]